MQFEVYDGFHGEPVWDALTALLVLVLVIGYVAALARGWPRV